MFSWFIRRRAASREKEAARDHATAAGGWPLSRALDLVMLDLDRRYGPRDRVGPGHSRSLTPDDDTARF
jgi:hypothetical protein